MNFHFCRVLCFYSLKFHLIFHVHVSSSCLHLCEYVCVCVFVLPSYWGPRWWSWSRGNQWRRRPDAHIRKLGEPETLQEPQMWFRNLFNHLDSSVREQNTSIEPQVEVKHTKRRNNKPRWVKRARKTDWRLIRANQKIHIQAVWGNFICWLVFSPQPQLISAKLSLPLPTHRQLKLSVQIFQQISWALSLSWNVWMNLQKIQLARLRTRIIHCVAKMKIKAEYAREPKFAWPFWAALFSFGLLCRFLRAKQYDMKN